MCVCGRVSVFSIVHVSHSRQQAQNHCHRCHLVALLLRGAIDQRFLTTGNAATVMMMLFRSGNTVVENGGAASGYLVLILLLILLMLTTTTGTATATTSAPGIIPLTFRRWLLQLLLLLLRLLLLLLDIATVRHDSTGNIVTVDRAERLMILRFTVNIRCAGASVVMMICRTVATSTVVCGRIAAQLDAHRLDVSV